MKKGLLIPILLFAVGAAGAFFYIKASRASNEAPPSEAAHAGEFCLEHQIAEAECPWCDPTLIAKLGECVEHGVPEALCSICNPKLIAGFKFEGDWCAEHATPESQCAICLAAAATPPPTR
jgi:hypothetical protein